MVSTKRMTSSSLSDELQNWLGAPRSTSPLNTDVPSRGGPIRILRLAQVLDATGLGKTKIYELQSKGSFPMRVQITAHSVGWIEEEVQTWLGQRVAARGISAGKFSL
jgi:prophage regulatory protein